MASLLVQRALVAARADTFGEIKDTLSSWDKCMSKTYCKFVVARPSRSGSMANVGQMARHCRNHFGKHHRALPGHVHCEVHMLRR